MLNSSQGFFDQDCLYLGDLLEWIDSIQSPESCQQKCFGNCKYSGYSKTNKKCYLLSSALRKCGKTLGLPSPTIDECKYSPFTSSTSIPETTTQSGQFFKLLVVGGNTGDGSIVDTAEFFNPYTDTNNCIQPPFYPLPIENTCGVENTFCGGYVTGLSQTDKCFRFSDGEWSETSSLLQARQNHACNMIEGNSYWIAGGIDLASILDSAEIRVEEDGAFSESKELPEPMERHCLAAINSTHFFMAGTSSNGRVAYLASIDNYVFKFNSLPPMIESRFSAGCGGIKTDTDVQLIVAGGKTADPQSTEIFSLKYNTWTKGPLLPRGFHNGGYFSDSQHPLLLVGGVDEVLKSRNDVIEIKYENGDIVAQILPGRFSTPRQNIAVSGLYTEDDC